MRFRASILLLAVLALMAGLRVSAAAVETEAMRCAILCGHAGAVRTGAACCPMGRGPDGGPSFKTCPGGAGSMLAPLAEGQTMLPVFAGRLDACREFRFLEPVPDAGPRPAFGRAPEKVPLPLG